MENDDVEAVAEQLVTYADALVSKLDRFLSSSDDDMPSLVRAAADRLSVSLVRYRDVSTATLLRELIGMPCTATDIDVAFWATPVGKAVARVVGYADGGPVPRKHAAAMLGVSRQRVSQLEAAGELLAVEGGLSDESVTARLARFGHEGAPPEE